MLRSPKSRARSGDIACGCCSRPRPARTLRAREKKAWKAEAAA